jgi:hypothetical protein
MGASTLMQLDNQITACHEVVWLSMPVDAVWASSPGEELGIMHALGDIGLFQVDGH